MKRIFLLLLICASTLVMYALGYSPREVPNPKNSTSNGWVSDPAHYLSAEAEHTIDSLCNNLKHTLDVELAVVMLPNIDEDHYDAFDFCQNLFNYWGIGGADKNTGVLVFFSEGSRDIRIHTGGGLEGLLPDITCDEIIDMALPLFQDGHYDSGVIRMVNLIYHQLMTEEAQQELLFGWAPKHPSQGISTGMLYILAGFILLLILIIEMYRKIPLDKELSLKERKEYLKKYKNYQFLAGILSFIFPFPLLFLWLYLKQTVNKNVRYAPATCPNCSKAIHIVKGDTESYLNDKEKTEASIGAHEFDVWHCDDCGNTTVVSHYGPRASSFHICPTCGALAATYVGTKVLKMATTTTEGMNENQYLCKHCGNIYKKITTIPVISSPPRSSSSGSSYGDSSSSRSSGGGSWGGGRSYGGGAGRKF